jgi:hypothetical protein
MLIHTQSSKRIWTVNIYMMYMYITRMEFHNVDIRSNISDIVLPARSCTESTHNIGLRRRRYSPIGHEQMADFLDDKSTLDANSRAV